MRFLFPQLISSIPGLRPFQAVKTSGCKFALMPGLCIAIALTLAVFFHEKIEAQSHTYPDFLPSLAEYRSRLLLRDANELGQLHLTMQKWASMGSDSETRLTKMAMLLYYAEVEKLSFSDIHEKQKWLAQKMQTEGITETDFHSVVSNAQLVSLILEGVIENKFPFKLERLEKLVTELNFYAFEAGEKIAEIGAGQGTFAVLVALTGEEVEYAITEIKPALVSLLALKSDYILSEIGSMQVDVVLGDKSATKLAQGYYDKIICRQSFHHFSKRQKMLRSIWESIKPGGLLFLNETTVEQNKSGCSKRMRDEQILRHVNKNGFRLLTRLEMEGTTLYKFVKEPKQ